MMWLSLALRLLERAGSLLITRDTESAGKFDHSSKRGTELPPSNTRLRLRTVPVTIVAFIAFAPICVATGGTFGECSDLFIKLNAYEVNQ